MVVGYNSDNSPDAAKTLDPLYTKGFRSPRYVTAAIQAKGIEPFLKQRALYSQALYIFNEFGVMFSDMDLKLERKPVSCWKDQKGRTESDKRQITLASLSYGPVVDATLWRQILAGMAGLEVVVHREAAKKHGIGKKRGEEAVEEYLHRIENVLVYGKDILNDGIEPEHRLQRVA